MRNVLIRTASGIVYIALMVAAVFTPWVAVPLLLFLAIVGLYEFYKLCPNPKFRWVGPIWILLPLCLLFLIWIPKSPAQVLGFFILIWMADTAAYVFGSLFGKHKLAPSISPGKTWEGFLCSCVITVGLAIGLSYIPFFQSAGLELWQWIVIALLTEVFGLMGDLIESLFKRKAGVKDSGNIIPGHGGVLDRVDSILFATLPVWLFCLMC
jgi:phosphatidate cytidylyltransferase